MEELKIEFSDEEFAKFTEGFKMDLNVEVELDYAAHKGILKENGIENKRLYNINGKDYIMTDDAFDQYLQNLLDKGYSIKSMIFDFPDSSEEFSESQIIVGRKNEN